MTQDEELARLDRLLKLCMNKKHGDARSNELDEKFRILRAKVPPLSEDERLRWLEEQRQTLPRISEERRARWLEERGFKR